MKRARIKASPLGEKLRVFARAYKASGQGDRAEGLLQAADTVDAELAGTTTGGTEDPLMQLVQALLAAVGSVNRAAEQLTEAAADLAAGARDDRPVRDFQNAFGVPSTAVGTVGRKTSNAARKVARVSKQPGLRRILTAVAQHPDGVTREQLTVLTGYKRSSRDTYLQRLRAGGLIGGADRICVTTEGMTELGPNFAPLPTGSALVDYWRGELPEGERRILDELLAEAPLTRDELSDRTGYKRSSRDTYLQRLRSRELIAVDSNLIYASRQLTG